MQEYRIVQKLIQIKRIDDASIIGPSEEQIKGFEGEINCLAKEGWVVKASNLVIFPNEHAAPSNNTVYISDAFSIYVLLERECKIWKDVIDGDFHG